MYTHIYTVKFPMVRHFSEYLVLLDFGSPIMSKQLHKRNKIELAFQNTLIQSIFHSIFPRTSIYDVHNYCVLKLQ